MQHRRLIVFSILLTAGSAVEAQTGTADLRYTAPLPTSITYVSVDSITNTMSGLPTGDMTTTTFIRAVSALSFTAATDGFDVTGVVRELEGLTETPMGNMPVSASDASPVTARITATGPAPDAVAEAPPGAGLSPGEAMGSAKAFAGLISLPRRQVALGESWADTVSMTPELDGTESHMQLITHGTYAADTVVDGRTLNVLEITSEMTMTMTGVMQGMNTSVRSTVNTEGRVLWDSGRHYVVSSDSSSTLRTETAMSDMGITMVMNGAIRSIITAEQVD
jgi:hypothetical protein